MTLDRLVRPWRGRLTKSRFEPWLRLTPSILYMAMLFGLSAIPGSDIPAVADDRIEHFLAYAGFGVVLAFTAAGLRSRPVERSELLACAVFGVLFGASDEWHQSFVPGRDASLKDLAFDTLGLAAALFMIYFLLRRAQRT